MAIVSKDPTPAIGRRIEEGNAPTDPKSQKEDFEPGVPVQTR